MKLPVTDCRLRLYARHACSTSPLDKRSGNPDRCSLDLPLRLLIYLCDLLQVFPRLLGPRGPGVFFEISPPILFGRPPQRLVLVAKGYVEMNLQERTVQFDCAAQVFKGVGEIVAGGIVRRSSFLSPLHQRDGKVVAQFRVVRVCSAGRFGNT